MIRILGFIVFILLLNGCGNKNILMPGQEYSDCEIADDNNGVCGLPLNLYKYRDKIQQLAPHPGSIYSIDDFGVIRNKKTKEIIEHFKKDKSNTILKSTKNNMNTNIQEKLDMKKEVLLRNNSLIIQHPSKMTHIRDLGYVQKIWIAPHENVNGTLVSAHDIFIVIKKPKWIVGEETPKVVNRGILEPSLMAVDAFTNSHKKVKIKDNSIINEYLKSKQTRNKEDMEIINEYLNKNKQK